MSPVSSSNPVSPPKVFDRHQLRRHRARAARQFEDFSFLKQRAVDDILDRLDVIPRQFETILDLGAHSGEIAQALRLQPQIRSRIGQVFSTDMALAFANKQGGSALVCDEEFLPFKSASFDAVLSSLTLHWVNDLPGSLIQIRHCLKPDGLFIGQIFGGRTLNELRTSLLEAESEICGGASLRVSPFVDLQDFSGLLQRAGFVMPVADTDVVTVRYQHPIKLLHDLRGMGETAAFFMPDGIKRIPLRRAVLFRAMEIYQERFSDADGRVRANFEILTASAWSPGPNQPQPLKPGSAKASLADALKSKPD